MAGQSVSWDEVEVQWDNVASSRIRATETSRSSDLGPATGKSVGEELETTNTKPDRGEVQLDSSLRGAVYRDNSLLALAWEDPDATLPYDQRCFYTLDPQELEVGETRGRSGITLVPRSRASSEEVPYDSLATLRGASIAGADAMVVSILLCLIPL